MSGSETSSPKKVLWASTTPLAGTTGRSAGTPRKHTRVVHAPPLRPLRCRVAAAGLLIAAALQIAAVFPHFGLVSELFPTFLSSDTLSSGLGAILQQVLPTVPLLCAAALLASGRPAVVRSGTGLALGAVGITLATVLFPLAQLFHYGTHMAGVGLWLSVGGALVAVVASAVILGELAHSWRLGRLERPATAAVLFATLAGAAVMWAYTQGWLVYHIDVTSLGHQTLQLPGGFDNSRWPVMAAEAIVLAVIAATIGLAVAWQPGRAGATVLLGLGAPLLGRLATTAVRDIEGLRPKDLGLSASQIQQLQVTFDKWLWIEAGGLVALGLLALYLALWPTDRSPADEA